MPLPANVNLAEKFSPKLDKAFKLSSYTDAYVNKDYDFDGVNSIKVWGLDSAPLVDYDVSSNTNRYGGFSEITDTLETYTLANDKAFSKSLDTLNEQDSMAVKKAASWLALQMNQRIVPTIDKDRFGTAFTAAQATGGGGAVALDTDDVLGQIYDMNVACEEVSAPADGRVFFCTPDVYKLIKKEVTPLLSQTTGEIVHGKGLCGQIDGVPVISVPSNLFPDTCKALFWHKSALLAARKLTETRILTNTHVVSGALILGRFRYDSWALSGLDSATGAKTKLATFQALTTA